MKPPAESRGVAAKKSEAPIRASETEASQETPVEDGYRLARV
jgi:hypothetical protein